MLGYFVGGVCVCFFIIFYFFLREQEREKSFIINPKIIGMDLSALSGLCSLHTPVVTGNPATLALLSPQLCAPSQPQLSLFKDQARPGWVFLMA